MKSYEVYKIEETTTNSGKKLKRLVLQGDGDQYPMKNVTIWEDNPLFDTLIVGEKYELNIEVKDSNQPNPHGGFYKNRTVLKPGQVPEAGVEKMRTDTNLMQKLDGIAYSLNRIEEHLGTLPKPKIGNTDMDYPMPEAQESENINPEDIPF